MRRLENADEEKFWEAWVKDDLIFCYRYGKIGSSGHLKIKKFASRAEAEAELEEKLAEKLEEGFEEPGADGAAEKASDDEDSESEDEASEDEAPAPKKASAATKDDEEEESEENDDEEEEEESEEDDDDEESEDDDEEKPKKKAAKPAAPKAAAAPEAPKPTLPTRVAARTPTKDDVARAKRALEELTAALGKRTWIVTRRAKAAARALERLGGADPKDHGELGKSFDELMSQVISAKRPLPLHVALRLLWETDSDVVSKVVSKWRSKMLASPAAAAIGVLAATFDAVPDSEVALHTSAALVDRALPSSAFTRRFAKVRPFLEASLKSKGTTVAAFLSSLKPDDALLKARVTDAKGVRG